MKLNYIIIAHNKFAQFKRLMDRLNQENTSFVINISSNCEAGFYEQAHAAYQDAPNVRFAPRIPIYWGDFSIVQASLNCIDTLVNSGFDYDYAIMLSGQDYPLQSHDTICDTLAAGNGGQFLEYFNPDSLKPDELHRMYSHHLWIKNKHIWYPHQGEPTLKIKLFDGILSLLLPKVRSLPNHYTGYKGSFWWHLNREAIEYIHAFTRSRAGRRLVRYFTFTYHSAELFYQTVLMNSPFKDKVINDDNHFALWNEKSGHPKDLAAEDFDALQASGRLFGRKFDIDKDSAIFDLLDDAAAAGNPVTNPQPVPLAAIRQTQNAD